MNKINSEIYKIDLLPAIDGYYMNGNYLEMVKYLVLEKGFTTDDDELFNSLLQEYEVLMLDNDKDDNNINYNIDIIVPDQLPDRE